MTSRERSPSRRHRSGSKVTIKLVTMTTVFFLIHDIVSIVTTINLFSFVELESKVDGKIGKEENVIVFFFVCFF